MASYHFSLLANAFPQAATVAIAGVFGLFVGSFLNVVIYRTPLGLSVSSPRSFCPRCRRQLTWWENLPVASWAVLGGRCRTCRNPISFRYPAVELCTGITFVLVTWGWHGGVVAAGYCCLSAAMIAVSLIEYGGERSPLAVAAWGTAVGLAIILAGAGWDGKWSIGIGSLLGTVVTTGIFAVLRITDPKCTDPRAHGRSALLLAGCWLGGLGLRPATIGIGVWIAVYFICMVATWMQTPKRTSDVRPQVVGRAHPVVNTPLVTALVLAMAASLVVRAI